MRKEQRIVNDQRFTSTQTQTDKWQQADWLSEFNEYVYVCSSGEIRVLLCFPSLFGLSFGIETHNGIQIQTHQCSAQFNSVFVLGVCCRFTLIHINKCSHVAAKVYCRRVFTLLYSNLLRSINGGVNMRRRNGEGETGKTHQTKPKRCYSTQSFWFEMNRLERSIQPLYCMNEGEIHK